MYPIPKITWECDECVQVHISIWGGKTLDTCIFSLNLINFIRLRNICNITWMHFHSIELNFESNFNFRLCQSSSKNNTNFYLHQLIEGDWKMIVSENEVSLKLLSEKKELAGYSLKDQMVKLELNRLKWLSHTFCTRVFNEAKRFGRFSFHNSLWAEVKQQNLFPKIVNEEKDCYFHT